MPDALAKRAPTAPDSFVPIACVYSQPEVVVPEEQAEDAMALLAEIDSGWTCPPRPFTDEAWVSLPLSLGLALFGIGPPPPRVQGSYGWKRLQAESGPPAR